MQDKDQLADVLDELKAVGITPDVARGGKHIKVSWLHNGQGRMHTVSNSPSDWRTPLNNISQLRAKLKADGLIVTDKPSEEPAAPNEPTVILKDGQPMTTSVAVAETFGKVHRDVVRSIDNLLGDLSADFGVRNFAQTTYLTSQNKSHRAFDLTRDGFTLLAMGFTGSAAIEWKVKYIAAFNAMEAQIRRATELSSVSYSFERRLSALEDDVRALIDLSLGRDAAPGFVYVKAHRRKLAGYRKALAA